MSNIPINSAILESHYFGINGSAIKYTTRNNCSDATAKILEEMAKILFPTEKIEIYVIPAKDGCHQDSFWIKVKNNPIGAAAVAVAATGVLVAFFAYMNQKDANSISNESSCLSSENLRIELQEKGVNIELDKCKDIIENLTIKTNNNKHFEQLQNDGEITKEKFVAIKNNEILEEKIIESIDFHKYIENLPKIKILKTIEKNHKLNVIKSVNDEDYKDLMWNFEDKNKKEKFGAYMSDEGFYKSHLQKPLGLKSLTVKIRYTIEENETGEERIKNKEIIKVYKYNDTVLSNIPKNEKIEPAPFEITPDKKENFKIVEKKEVVQKDDKQMQMF